MLLWLAPQLPGLLMLHVPGLTAPTLVESQGGALAAQVESGLMQSFELERTQVGGVVGATQ